MPGRRAGVAGRRRRAAQLVGKVVEGREGWECQVTYLKNPQAQ